VGKKQLDRFGCKTKSIGVGNQSLNWLPQTPQKRAESGLELPQCEQICWVWLRPLAILRVSPVIGSSNDSSGSSDGELVSGSARMG